MTLFPKHQMLNFSSLPSEISSLAHTLFQTSTPSVVIISLTDVSKQTKDSVQLWLHDNEIIQLSKFSYEKRYREWLAGRICAKQSLHMYLQQEKDSQLLPGYNRCEVAAEESGRPFFKTLEGIIPPFPELSISHSKEFATAMISQDYCGIDIQYPAENLLKVKERFVTEDEELLLQKALTQLPILSRLALAWAGKEAVKKMLSPSGNIGFSELILKKVIYRNTKAVEFYFSRAENSNVIFSVAAGLLNNGYSLALCCQTNQSQPYH